MEVFSANLAIPHILTILGVDQVGLSVENSNRREWQWKSRIFQCAFSLPVTAPGIPVSWGCLCEQLGYL